MASVMEKWHLIADPCSLVLSGSSNKFRICLSDCIVADGWIGDIVSLPGPNICQSVSCLIMVDHVSDSTQMHAYWGSGNARQWSLGDIRYRKHIPRVKALSKYWLLLITILPLLSSELKTRFCLASKDLISRALTDPSNDISLDMSTPFFVITTDPKPIPDYRLIRIKAIV